MLNPLKKHLQAQKKSALPHQRDAQRGLYNAICYSLLKNISACRTFHTGVCKCPYKSSLCKQHFPLVGHQGDEQDVAQQRNARFYQFFGPVVKEKMNHENIENNRQ